jgi:hypothetical protein
MSPRWNYTTTINIEDLIGKEIEFAIYRLSEDKKEILIG